MGEEMKGHLACHTCDNRPCCNPRHLYRGTRQDNARDATTRGRYTSTNKSFPGERNPKAKLTPDQVQQARALRGLQSATQVAAQLGVTQYAIRSIWKGKTWSHLPGM